MLFTFWVILENVGRIYFIIFSTQIFLHCFPIVHFWEVIYSFFIIFSYESLNVYYLFRIIFNCFMIWGDCYSGLKAFVIFFIDRIYWCFFVFYLVREFTYDSRFILWQLWYSNWTRSKPNLLPFIDISNPIWYLKRSDWKSYCITSSA